jgi:hypothetical protein
MVRSIIDREELESSFLKVARDARHTTSKVNDPAETLRGRR